MTPDELSQLERIERERRYRAFHTDTPSDRRDALDAELETYRAEMGDDYDD